MKYKVTKTLMIVFILLFPFYAFSGSLLSDTSNSKSVYLSAAYKLSTPFFNHLSVEESGLKSDNVKDKRVIGLKNNILVSADEAIKNLSNFDFSKNYVPEYKNSLFGLSFAFGYSFENLKVEVEGFYEKFDVKDTKNHIINNNYRHFALSRKNSIDSEYVTLINNGIKFYSIMLNVCYDFVVDNTYFTPFLCVGVGENIINIFDSLKFKPAFHSKVGFNYMISQSASLFVDVYYHRVIGNQYSNISVKDPKNILSTSASVKLDIGYFGSEIGIRIFI